MSPIDISPIKAFAITARGWPSWAVADATLECDAAMAIGEEREIFAPALAASAGAHAPTQSAFVKRDLLTREGIGRER